MKSFIKTIALALSGALTASALTIAMPTASASATGQNAPPSRICTPEEASQSDACNYSCDMDYQDKQYECEMMSVFNRGSCYTSASYAYQSCSSGCSANCERQNL